MIVKLKKMMAYICPYCSEVTIRRVTVFDIPEKGSLELKCRNSGCRETCAMISDSKDKYKISIECPICDENHTHKVKKSAFWNNDIIGLDCPMVGVGIFYTGTQRKVADAITESMNFMLEQNDIYDGDELDVLCAMMELLQKLDSESRISCACGDPDIKIELENGVISVKCLNCNNRLIIYPDKRTFYALAEESLLMLRKNDD